MQLTFRLFFGLSKPQDFQHREHAKPPQFAAKVFRAGEGREWNKTEGRNPANRMVQMHQEEHWSVGVTLLGQRLDLRVVAEEIPSGVVLLHLQEHFISW